MNKSLYQIANLTIGAGILLYAAHACQPKQQTEFQYQPTLDPCAQTEYVFDPNCMNEVRPIVEKPDFSRESIKTLDTLINE